MPARKRGAVWPERWAAAGGDVGSRSEIGIVYLDMKFPLWTNQKKVRDFKVIGTLPMTTGMFVGTTKTYIRQDDKETEIGMGLHRPIFHPTLPEPPQTKALDHACVSDTVAEIVQILGAYVNAFRRGIPLHRHTQGKSTVLLYGPYDKEAVARGVADALKIRFESCNVLELIKEYPDDAVTAVNKFLLRKAVRGLCLIFLGRFDEVAPYVGCGYTYITDVITTQLKFLLDEPSDSAIFIIAAARWRTIIEPGITSRIRCVLFCGPKEGKEDWDSVGINLLHLMMPSNSGQHSRWNTPNLVLYGWKALEKQDIVRSFAACRSLKVVTIEAPQLLHRYSRVGDVAVSDLFLRAASERPALLFIDQFDAVRDHPMARELCFQLDSLDNQVHVFVAVSWWQLINAQLLQPGRLDKHMFCGSAGKTAWDLLGQSLLKHQSKGQLGRQNMR